MANEKVIVIYLLLDQEPRNLGWQGGMGETSESCTTDGFNVPGLMYSSRLQARPEVVGTLSYLFIQCLPSKVQ